MLRVCDKMIKLCAIIPSQEKKNYYNNKINIHINTCWGSLTHHTRARKSYSLVNAMQKTVFLIQ